MDKMKRNRLMAATITFWASIAMAQTASAAWSFKDWSVSNVAHQTTQDSGLTCAMETSATSPGLLQMKISQFSLDAGPPHVYPTIQIFPGVNNGPMAVEEQFVSKWVFDGQTTIITQLSWHFDDQQNAFTVNPQDSQKLLSAMAKGHKLTMKDDTFGSTTFSLAGFSASYRKMSSECRFSLKGVLE